MIFFLPSSIVTAFMPFSWVTLVFMNCPFNIFSLTVYSATNLYDLTLFLIIIQKCPTSEIIITCLRLKLQSPVPPTFLQRCHIG